MLEGLPPLPLSFYQDPDVLTVAKSLLGKILCSSIDGELTAGIITETEGYAGVQDRACHAYGQRRTKRTEVLYKQGGVSYVYLCYGMHCLLNAVTSFSEDPQAVLIRSLHPLYGIDVMRTRRKKPSTFQAPFTQGPGALAQALGISRIHNEHSLNQPPLWIAESNWTPSQIQSGPRIGVDFAQEDALLPYRFWIEPPQHFAKSK